MRTIYTTGIVCCAGFAVAASLSVFTDPSDYINALDSVETETFADAPIGTVLEGTVVDLGDLTFSYIGSPDGGPNDIFDGQPLFQFVDNTLDVQFMGEVNVDGSPSGLHFFEFSEPVYGFSGDFIGASSGSGLTLSVSDKPQTAGTQSISFLNTLGGDGTGFLGIVSVDPFTTVAFGTEGNNGKSSEVFRINEITYGQVGTVPLPSAAIFLLTMIAAFPLLAKFRTRQT